MSTQLTTGSKRQLALDDVESPATQDEQLWPVNVLLLMIAASLAGLVIARGDFHSPEPLLNGWVHLGLLGTIVLIMALSALVVHHGAQRRMQLALFGSLVLHLWLSLGMIEFKLPELSAIEEPKPVEPEPEPFKAIDYGFTRPERGDAKSFFEHPVETAIAQPIDERPAPKQAKVPERKAPKSVRQKGTEVTPQPVDIAKPPAAAKRGESLPGPERADIEMPDVKTLASTAGARTSKTPPIDKTPFDAEPGEPAPRSTVRAPLRSGSSGPRGPSQATPSELSVQSPEPRIARSLPRAGTERPLLDAVPARTLPRSTAPGIGAVKVPTTPGATTVGTASPPSDENLGADELQPSATEPTRSAARTPRGAIGTRVGSTPGSGGIGPAVGSPVVSAPRFGGYGTEGGGTGSGTVGAGSGPDGVANGGPIGAMPSGRQRFDDAAIDGRASGGGGSGMSAGTGTGSGGAGPGGTGTAMSAGSGTGPGGGSEPGDSDVPLVGTGRPSAKPTFGAPARGSGSSLAGLGGAPTLDPGLPSPLARPESELVHADTPRMVFERAGGGQPSIDSRVRDTAVPGLRQRDRGMRQAIAEQRGGSTETEKAVERGLEFLARFQGADGSWTLHHRSPGFDYPVPEIPQLHSQTAATGLALLSFLGAGYTHTDGQYRTIVRRALDHLIAHQQANGDLFVRQDDGSNSSAWLYSHGIAAIALCEAYGMTRDAALREPAQKALDFIAFAQSREEGGWRYAPQRGSDTSVSGWQVMALKSGELAGLKIDRQCYARLTEWLDGAAAADGQPGHYAYLPDSDTASYRAASTVMTAEALLMRQYLGWRRERPEMISGADWLRQNLPQFGTATRQRPTGDRNAYYWYYATQVMFQMQGPYWDAWNAKLRPMLLGSQVSSGALSGSWDPVYPVPDRFGYMVGRHYVTTLHLLMLEVYYRHLPIYQTLDDNR